MLNSPWKEIVTLLIQILIGVGVGFYFTKVLKKSVHIWVAVVVSVIGSVLGSFFLHKLIVHLGSLITNPLSVDFVSATIGAVILIWIFSKLARRY